MKEKCGGAFESMTPERVREGGERGGRRAQQKGTAHRWTTDTAKAANKKALEERRRRRDSPNPDDTQPERR